MMSDVVDDRHEVCWYSERLRLRAHNLLRIDTTTEREKGVGERARQIVAMVVVMVQCEKK